MRWWLVLNIVFCTAFNIHPVEFEDAVLHLRIDTDYYSNDKTEIKVPIIALGPRSFCRQFKADDEVDFKHSFSNVAFEGKWSNFLEAAFDDSQNPTTLNDELLRPDWIRYSGEYADGQWFVDRRGGLNMTLNTREEGVTYHVAAPIMDLPLADIPLAIGADFYEAQFVVTAMIVQKDDAGYFVYCWDDRIHVDTRNGYSAVTIEDASSGEVVAYFSGLPNWMQDDNIFCSLNSTTCYVEFKVALGIRRFNYFDARAVYRILDNSQTHSPHSRVDSHGLVQSTGSLPSDVFYVTVQTPRVNASTLLDGRDCGATATLNDYGMGVVIAQCEEHDTTECGEGAVLDNGLIDSGKDYDLSELYHARLDIEFAWNTCPKYATQSTHFNLDARLFVYEHLEDIVSVVGTGGFYSDPPEVSVAGGELVYADFRVLLTHAHNVSLKLFSAVLVDEDNDLQYTLVANYTPIEAYRGILHRGTCWEQGSAFGQCQLGGDDALRTRAHGEAFDVIAIVAPKNAGQHHWTLLATAVIVDPDVLHPIINSTWPNQTELEGSNITVVQFHSSFRVHNSIKTASTLLASSFLFFGFFLALFVLVYTLYETTSTDCSTTSHRYTLQPCNGL